MARTDNRTNYGWHPAGRYTPEARELRRAGVPTYEHRPYYRQAAEKAELIEWQLARHEAELAATEISTCVRCGARMPSTPFLLYRDKHGHHYCGCAGFEH